MFVKVEGCLLLFCLPTANIKKSNGEQGDLILIGRVIDLVQNLNCIFFGTDVVSILHAP